MDIWVLDDQFRNLYVIDEASSVIWNESYIGCGDFEIYSSINEYTLKVTSFIRDQRSKDLDTYIWLKGSDQVMIAEAVELSTDVESGPKILISGRSLEIILARRIIWTQTILDSKLDHAIKRLITENAISPANDTENGINGSIRKIPNLIYKDSTDKRIQEMHLSKQFTGDNLYEAIYSVLEPLDVGFHITLNAQNQFVFELYMGEDRSYDQLDHQFIIFSPGFDNLIRSNWLEDVKEYRNVTLVAGENEGKGRRTYVAGDAQIAGLKRREIFTDARDIQSEIYDEEGNVQEVPTDEYLRNLKQRGDEKLSEWKFIKTFEGEVDATIIYKYGQDFFRGDIVQVETEYGIRSKMRIMQFVRSQDASGTAFYPVFKILEDDK